MSADELPSGVVTFVFTDMQGSTRLGQLLGSGFRPLMETHNRLVDGCVRTHRGHVVADTGDGVMAVFGQAHAAVAACADIQRALARHPWPEGAQVQVRIGVHTGWAVPQGGAYVSLVAHKAARIMQAGHGGQVLMSSGAVRAATPLPQGLQVQVLGEVVLKDFDEPEEVAQLLGVELARDFPQLRVPMAAGHGLPDQLSALIGREPDLAALSPLLLPGSVVTLVGIPGVGKTRLALALARTLIGAWPVDVRFVDLTAVAPGADITSVVARSLGISALPGRDLGGLIASTLNQRPMLVVLDNAEHVLEACSGLVESLQSAAPGSAFLVTSRSRLGISAERVHHVEALDVPADGSSALALSSASSVQLLLSRFAVAGVALDDDEIRHLGAVARALDGIPLALELAAARAMLLTPFELLESLLADGATGGARDTLTGTLDWSFQLCRPAEQLLLARLSVFAAGADLATIRRVCADTALPIAEVDDALTGLVAKNLVVASALAGRRRFRLLQAIRAFAADHLGPDVTLEARARHREWAMEWTSRRDAESTAQRDLRLVAEQSELLEVIRLAQHDEPLDAAVLALQLHPVLVQEGDLTVAAAVGEALLKAPGLSEEITLGLANAVARGWLAERRWTDVLAHMPSVISRAVEAGNRDQEWRARVNVVRAQIMTGELPVELPDFAAAAQDPALDAATRLHALEALAVLARANGDLSRMALLAEQVRALNLELDDAVSAAVSLQLLGHTKYMMKDLVGALADYQASHEELIAAAAPAMQVAMAKGTIGSALHALADYEGARVMLLEADAIMARLGIEEPQTQSFLATVEVELGHLDQARDLLERVIRRSRTSGGVGEIIEPLIMYVEVQVLRGDLDSAEMLAAEALAAAEHDGIEPYKRGHAHLKLAYLHRLRERPAEQLRHLAAAYACDSMPAHEVGVLIAAAGDARLGARLVGAAAAHEPPRRVHAAMREQDRADLVAQLGPQDFTALAEEGKQADSGQLRGWLEAALATLGAAVPADAVTAGRSGS